MEGDLKSLRRVGVQGEPMKVKLITDEIIEAANLKCVDNPIPLEKADIPTVGGLFSEYIFGTTRDQRTKTFAYIDLKHKFFHPFVFENIVMLNRKIRDVAAGIGQWQITDSGELKELDAADDSFLGGENTGMAWLVNNFDRIVFKESDSNIRKTKLKFIHDLTDKEKFITKWLVIPVFYRDIDNSAGVNKIPPINDLYANLIRYSDSLDKNTAGFMSNRTMFAIQNNLVEIRKYGQSLIESKKGFFKQSVIGKSTDFGQRSVISTPLLEDCDKPEDMTVTVQKTGIPLSQCLVMGFPFIMRWLTDFFRKEFETAGKSYPIMNMKTGEITYEELDDPLSMYTEDYIHKMVDTYKNTYGTRFNPVQIPLRDGKMGNMVFTGRYYANRPNDPRSSTISNRSLTWTDLLYIAAVESLSDKYVYITRYPLTDYNGTFPTGIEVLSTVKTMPVMIGDNVYKHYPVIDPSMPESKVSSFFIDTLSMSNMYLKGIGGD